jgi:hypothetical protein
MSDPGAAEIPAGYDVKAMDLVTRTDVWIREAMVAAVMDLPNTATRVIFVGGGHVDICGSAEGWRQRVRRAQIAGRAA